MHQHPLRSYNTHNMYHNSTIRSNSSKLNIISSRSITSRLNISSRNTSSKSRFKGGPTSSNSLMSRHSSISLLQRHSLDRLNSTSHIKA